MLFNTNPWWKTKKVPEALCGRKRSILTQLQALMPYRQMVMITGLRRTGKSTLMYQLIQHLLESGVSETAIFYFSFDTSVRSLQDLLQEYVIEILKTNLDMATPTVFFDEIQKVPNWENQIKQLYDRYPNIKFVLSGSTQLTMLRGSRESLAGRFFERRIHPMDFSEYLEFEGKQIPEDKEMYFETELKIWFEAYLYTGGFIDCFALPQVLQQQYLREGVLDQVLFRDIPLTWPVRQPDALRQIMRVITSHIGFYLDYRSLGNDLNMDQRTVAAYVDYLDLSLLVQKCYNYSSNQLTSEKKRKRLYPANVGFSRALNPELSLPQLCEHYFITKWQGKYFYRSSREEEVDLVLLDKHSQPLPVEIKIRNTLKQEDLKPLIHFMKRFSCPQGIVITKDTQAVLQLDHDRNIHAIPYWKYHTLNHCFSELL